MNSSSPSFRLIELTIDLPWIHFKPASMTLHLDESITIGTFATSGSDANKFKNSTMTFSDSNNPSSILMSINWAPLSICSFATFIASSKLFSCINLLNFAEPVTFVLSPILIKLILLSLLNASSPDTLSIGFC